MKKKETIDDVWMHDEWMQQLDVIETDREYISHDNFQLDFWN